MSDPSQQTPLHPYWEPEKAALLLRLPALLPVETPIHSPAATLRIVLATPAESPLVLSITQAAFAEYEGLLDPPNTAAAETVADVHHAMTEGGNLLAWVGTDAVASARFRFTPDHLYVGRLAVLPEQRGRGIASALMHAMEAIARATGRPEIALGTRMHLTRNIALYAKLGYKITKTHQHPRGKDIIAWLSKQV